VSFWEDLVVSLGKSREKICTKVLPFVHLGQRRGGGVGKRGEAPLRCPNLIRLEQEKLKRGEVPLIEPSPFPLSRVMDDSTKTRHSYE